MAGENGDLYITVADKYVDLIVESLVRLSGGSWDLRALERTSLVHNCTKYRAGLSLALYRRTAMHASHARM